jgi:hypothetical protein
MATTWGRRARQFGRRARQEAYHRGQQLQRVASQAPEAARDTEKTTRRYPPMTDDQAATAAEVRELLEDADDAREAREALAWLEAGEQPVPAAQVWAELGLEAGQSGDEWNPDRGVSNDGRWPDAHEVEVRYPLRELQPPAGISQDEVQQMLNADREGQ